MLIRVSNIIYQTGFKAIGVESGTEFEDIDLREGDWADYDEKVFFLNVSILYHTQSDDCLYSKSGVPVGISEIESEFRRA